MRPHRVFLLGFTILACMSAHAAAQNACSTWDPRFRSPGVGLTTDWAGSQITLGRIDDAFDFDDGSGSALYVGGDFTSVAGAPAKALARRRSGGWEAVGSGPLPLLGLGQGRVEALAAFSNGSAPALFAAINDDNAGNFELGAWDGSSWTSMGGGSGAIHALEVYDDGSGSALYVGGEFTSVGTLSGANSIARWTPAGWSLVGSGVSGGTSPAVFDFTIHDDGSGPALVVAGRFTNAGGVAGSCVARWNGGWSTFSGTFSNEVRAVTSFNDGSGARLYAGGSFSASGGIGAANLVRRNGSTWSALPSLSSSSAVLTLATSTASGAGTELLIGAEDAISFTNAGVPGTSYGCALWSGSTWTQMNANPIPAPAGSTTFTTGGARAFADFDPGTGPRAYVLGGFPQLAGVGVNGLARWNGTAIEVDDAGQGFDWPADVIRELHFPTASDTQIFAAGAFLNAGPTPVQPSGTPLTARARTVAKWDGTSWTGMGNGLPNVLVSDLIAYDPGTGPILFAATQSGLYRWNAGTSTWGLVTGTLAPSGVIRRLCVYNGELFVSGAFLNRVRRWNGTAWNNVGPGLGGGTTVTDLEVYNPGTGAELFACGDFNAINPSTATPFIASWNGTAWTALPTLPTTPPNSLRNMTVYDDGTGPKLIVTALRTLSSNTVTDVLSWNGSAWGTLSTFLQGPTFDIAATDRFPGGGASFPFTRSRLVAAGSYIPSTSSIESLDLLEWTGTGWQSFGSCTALPLAFSSITLGTGGANGHAELWVAGAFESMSGVASGGLALHRDCAFQTFCAGDGLDTYVIPTPCPCGNYGAFGQGCQNKSGNSASLTASGDVLPPSGAFTDTVVLTCTGLNPATTEAIFMEGDALLASPTAVLFGGNGINCISGNLYRIRAVSVTPLSGVASFPGPGDPTLSQRAYNAGDHWIVPGATRYYFVVYRDSKCTTLPVTGSNTSNALAIVW